MTDKAGSSDHDKTFLVLGIGCGRLSAAIEVDAVDRNGFQQPRLIGEFLGNGMNEPLFSGPSRPAFPDAGRLAGVDYGTVRVGIAICDPGRILVSPLEIMQRSDPQRESDFFCQLVRQERIAGFVVGLPIHCDGGESDKSRESRKFALWLCEQTGLPVRLFDERFTTADATRRLRSGGLKSAKRKQRLDAVAAQILLEAFLEAARYARPGQLPGQALEQPGGGEAALDDHAD